MNDSIDPVYESLNRKIGKKVFKRTSYIHKQALLGKITPQQRFSMLSRKCNIPAEKLKSMLTHEYIKIIKVNRDVVKIAERLRKRNYKTAIISNMTEMAKKVNKKRGLFRNFNPVVLSCNVGVIKPHKRIFDVFMKKIKLKPHECIFIDDREEHLHYPKNIGIKVIHFKNALQIEKDLKKYGVKI